MQYEKLLNISLIPHRTLNILINNPLFTTKHTACHNKKQ